MLRCLLLCLCLTAAGLAAAQKITSFETPEEIAVLQPSGGLEARQVQEHATDGQSSLRISAPGLETDSWPGLMYEMGEQDLSRVAVLALDTFNPQDAPVQLSIRVDDASGKVAFSGSPIAPGQSTVELWLSELKFSLDLAHIVRIYIYFSSPRSDIVLFMDRLRYGASSVKLRAMVFEETNPEPEYSEQDRERGYAVFARHWLSTIFPNSRPLPHELQPQLGVFACPGQTVPVTCCVRALSDLGATTLRTADLTSGRNVLPAPALRVYPVRYRHRRRDYGSTEYIQDMPNLLERRESVPIAAGRTQLFWINVTVPEGTPAGVYEGKLTVQPAQGQPSEVPVRVRVLPYRLAEPKHMFWGEYYMRPSLVKTPEEARARLVEELTDQRAHGMTTVGLCFGPEPDEYRVEGTTVTLGFKPDGLYSAFMEAYKALRFPMPVVLLDDTGQAAAGAYPFGSDEYVAVYQGFWRQMQALHKERGWPELFVQPVDEPGWQGPEERARNVACLKWLKAIPGQRTEQDGPVDAYFISEAGPFADMWNGNGQMPPPDVMKQAQADGKIVTSYNNDVESYRPEMGRLCNGFFQLRAGGRGTFNWAYVCYSGDPYDDLDGKSGDFLHSYPAVPVLGEVGGPSTGWEGARAGVDDFKYAHTLKQAIARAEASRRSAARHAAKAAEQALADVLASLTYDPQTRDTARFAEELPQPDGTRILHGPLKVPNGWEFEMYDKARWRLAQATVEVMAALGEVEAHRAPGTGAPTRPASGAPTRLASGAPTRSAGDFLQNPTWSRQPETSGVGTPSVQQQVSIPLVGTAPVCDGDLADAVWQQAAVLSPFVKVDGSAPASQQTIVRLCADAANLYIAAEAQEENIGHITARVNEDAGPMWEDDCLEVFIDPTGQGQEYIQIVINSLGKVAAIHPRESRWQPALQRGARVDAVRKRWTVELGMPLEALKLTTGAFGLNVCRERRPLESLELSCWSPTGERFGRPDRFGVATLGGGYLADFRVGRGVLGRNEVTATVRNDDTVAHSFTVILDWKQGKQVALYRQKGPVALEPGQQEMVALPYEVTNDREPLSLGLKVRDATTERTFAERRLEQQVLPALRMALKPNLCYLSDDTGQLRVDINLNEELQDRATLTVALFRGGSTTALRSQTLPVNNERLDVAVNLGGLPAGAYRLEAILKSGPTRLATGKATVTKLEGPF